MVVVGGNAPWVARLPIPAMGTEGWGSGLGHLRRRVEGHPDRLRGLMEAVMEAKTQVRRRACPNPTNFDITRGRGGGAHLR